MYLLDVDSTSPTLYFVMVSISLIIVSKRYLHNEALGLYFFIKTGISLEKIISLNHMWVQVLFQYYTPLLSSIFIFWLSHYLISPFPISYVKSFVFCYHPYCPPNLHAGNSLFYFLGIWSYNKLCFHIWIFGARNLQCEIIEFIFLGLVYLHQYDLQVLPNYLQSLWVHYYL